METETKNKVAMEANKEGAKKNKDRRNRSKKSVKNKSASKDSNKPKNTLLPEQSKKQFHSNLPQLPVKRVTEPKEVCPMCNQVIEGIASSMVHPEGGHCHFDCVLAKIAADEKIGEKEKVSYIGRGTFAVVKENDDGSFTFSKRIVWETPESFDAMKKFVEATKK